MSKFDKGIDPVKPEVGKTYQVPGYRKFRVGRCIFVGQSIAIFIDVDDNSEFTSAAAEDGIEYCWAGIREYTSPASITEYVNVYKRSDGSLMFGGLCANEALARNHAGGKATGNAYLATIPVTYTEPQS